MLNSVQISVPVHTLVVRKTIQKIILRQKTTKNRDGWLLKLSA